MTKPTHLKIILKKKGGKRVRGVPIGICVTKMNSPIDPPAAKIIKPGKEQAGRMLASSIPKNGQTYADTLKQTNKNVNNEKIPQFEPPTLSKMERKLQILPGEWFEESQFKNDDVAALYAFYQPTQGPFIIVPAMDKSDY